MSSETHECDVAVIGSGAAGLSAALAARTRGADVVVVEKSEQLGGTSAMSGGNVWVPCHHHQPGIGVKDSREEALEYIRAASPPGWHNTEDSLWAAFVDHAPRMLRFLERHSPLRFVPNGEPDPYAELPGGKRSGRNVSAAPLSLRILREWSGRLRACAPTLRYRLRYEELVDTSFIAHPRKWMLRFGPKLAWRLITGQQTMGGALVVGLLRGCLDAGCTLWSASPARALIRTGGRIEGVEVERGTGAVKLLARKGVVLASGGFEWNAELMTKHFPGPVEWTGSPATNTGDGHRMAAAIGARLDHMDQALVIGTMPYLYEGRVQGTPSADFMLPHAMIVNRHARRFVNEKAMNIGLAFEERDAGSGLPVHLPAWRIYDGQFARKYPHALPPRRFAGVRYEDRTLEGLARKIDLDPAALIGKRPALQRVRAHRCRRGLRARRVDLGSGAPRRSRSRPQSGARHHRATALLRHALQAELSRYQGRPPHQRTRTGARPPGHGDSRSLRGGKRDGEPLRLQGCRGRYDTGPLPHLGSHLRPEHRRRAIVNLNAADRPASAGAPTSPDRRPTRVQDWERYRARPR